MFNNKNKVFAALLTLAALLLRDGSGVAAHLNVFLNSEEVMRLLGKFYFSLLFPPTLPRLFLLLLISRSNNNNNNSNSKAIEQLATFLLCQFYHLKLKNAFIQNYVDLFALA